MNNSPEPSGSASPAREYRNAIVHWLFAHCPWAFRKSPAYQHWLESQYRNLAEAAVPELYRLRLHVAELDIRDIANPEVSIIVHGSPDTEITLACLRAILGESGFTTYELLFLLNDSESGLDALIRLSGRFQYIQARQRDNDIPCSSLAVTVARGKYLLYLHDTISIREGWLDAMHDTFATIHDAGLVFPRLFDSQGQLLDNAGILEPEADGTVPRGLGDPRRPQYRFLRNADKCTTACCMIPKSLFGTLEGIHAPPDLSEYALSGLCRAIKSTGRRLLYQPFATVVDCAPTASGGGKESPATTQDFGTAAPTVRRQGRFVLVTDVITPHPDQDSGSMDTVNYIRMLQALGYNVVFCSYTLHHDGPYTEALQKLGVECLYAPYTESLLAHLAEFGGDYELVLLTRIQHEDDIIAGIRTNCPNAALVFNTVDLHFLREQRQADIENSPELLAQSLVTRQRELSIMQQCDATIVISDTERQLLRQENPDLRVHTLPYIRETRPAGTPFSDRRDIVFIGGFLFQPNLDAVRYFVQDIWPSVHQRLPDVRFLVIGSNMPEAITRFGDIPGVETLGFVEHLDIILARCRLSVAPLRFGAGIKGKIGTCITHGVPCVATPVAAEGMGLEHGKNIMIGKDAGQIADALVQVYQDEKLWNKLSHNGLEFFETHYSFAAGLARLETLLGELPACNGGQANQQGIHKKHA